MSSLIFFLLIITGLISMLALIWFSFKLIELYLGPKERKLKSRLLLLANDLRLASLPIGDQVSKSDTSFTIMLSRQEARLTKWLEFQISKSGLEIGAENFVLGSLIFSLFILVSIFIALDSYYLALLLALIASLAPYLALKLFIQRRQTLLERELPDLLDFMARSLQVGHSFNTTLQMAAAEAPMPLSIEFKRVFEELNFGAPLQKVLSDLSNRIDCSEIRYFVIAVIVNREIGGDLAEILKRVSQLIRDRIDFHQNIRVLSSEGKASALILGGLPFFVAGLIFFINPESINLLLNDSLGRDLLLYAGVLMAFGFFWMNRLCEVRV